MELFNRRLDDQEKDICLQVYLSVLTEVPELHVLLMLKHRLNK